jgi:hypothetical protein
MTSCHTLFCFICISVSEQGCQNIRTAVALLVVLYGFQTCSLTSSEEHRLRVSENLTPIRIRGFKGENVTAKWR